MATGIDARISNTNNRSDWSPESISPVLTLCQILRINCNRSVRKTINTASKVPRCNITSKNNCGSFNPNKCWKTTRWPELLTGINSVTPWIKPRIAAWCKGIRTNSLMFWLSSSRKLGSFNQGYEDCCRPECRRGDLLRRDFLLLCAMASAGGSIGSTTLSGFMKQEYRARHHRTKGNMGIVA